MGKNWRKLWVQHTLWSSKILFVFESRLIFFSNGHICNFVSTFPNIVKIDVENDNVVLTLSNIFQFNVEIVAIVVLAISYLQPPITMFLPQII